MKLAAIILATLSLLGCSDQDRTKGLPISPSPFSQRAPVPTPTTGGFWGMVLEEDSAACIVGATVEVIGGVRQGEIQVQSTPCSYWDYDGGFDFENLPISTQLTLRASAPGYAAKEFTATAAASGGGIYVKLSRLP